ncbi:MAG: hypothetical protein ACT4P6_22815 [Gemmatimonadaceae bacterium]
MPFAVKTGARAATFALSVVIVASCESTLSVQGNDLTWGFLQTGALAATGTGYVTAPTGQFFVGNLGSIPDARVKPDTCLELVITNASPLQVTFLDAGSLITTQFGTKVDTLPRVSSSTRTTYERSTPISFRPGDSLVVRIPGANGGFPAAEIRAKTAEAFTFDSLIIRPSPAAVQLRWTPSTDVNSAFIAEFRYSSTGGTTFNQLIRCTFVDDGVDSVAFRVLQPWVGQGTSSRNATYTRLRTNIVSIVDGFLEVISTFAVPTPRAP